MSRDKFTCMTFNQIIITRTPNILPTTLQYVYCTHFLHGTFLQDLIKSITRAPLWSFTKLNYICGIRVNTQMTLYKACICNMYFPLFYIRFEGLHTEGILWKCVIFLTIQLIMTCTLFLCVKTEMKKWLNCNIYACPFEIKILFGTSFGRYYNAKTLSEEYNNKLHFYFRVPVRHIWGCYSRETLHLNPYTTNKSCKWLM